MLTNTKPLTVRDLIDVLTTLPPHTPVKCHVHVTAYFDERDRERGYADFHGAASVTGVHTELNEVVLEVEE